MSAAQQFLRSALQGLAVGGPNFGSTYKKPAVSDAFKSPSVSLKGMYTGFQPQRDLDLSSFYGNSDPDIESAFSALPYQQDPNKTKPTYPETLPDFKNLPSPPTGDLTWEKLEELQAKASQRRKEENLYDAYLANQQFQSYLPAMEQMAARTRGLDYGYGLMADIYSPTRQAARSAQEQQKIATAVGAEAAMLGAVNQAAYQNAMANIAGLRSGKRTG